MEPNPGPKKSLGTPHLVALLLPALGRIGRPQATARTTERPECKHIRRGRCRASDLNIPLFVELLQTFWERRRTSGHGEDVEGVSFNRESPNQWALIDFPRNTRKGAGLRERATDINGFWSIFPLPGGLRKVSLL